MKDIAKLREEYDRKLKYAEYENELEERVGVSCSIIGSSLTQKGKTHVYFGSLSKEQTSRLLKEMPSTEDALTSGRGGVKMALPHILSVSRSPREAHTMLEMEWIHGEWDISLKMPLDPGDGVLMQYFRQGLYEIDNATIGLFYGAVSPREKSRLKDVPYLTFNSGDIIRYKGGRDKQLSAGHAECIISEIIGG